MPTWSGICEVPEYAWFSHESDGTPIETRHKYAVVIVIDQGWDTFEASSGDDWVSGAQSYRAYLNGSTTATIVADYIRRLGYPAQAHSNAHGDVMQIPLMLLAGLGEMSRIGELVLNPFIGPRHKTAIVTTDLPLIPDKPIDFGLQDFCDKCRKCARECPAQAIPFGDKVLYNGYEIWKPDVEKCTKYRVTNLKGSACGRCMKMCPWNKEGLLAHRLAMWTAIKLPFSRRFLIWLDDALGYGKRNPVKRWWLDLVKEDGRVVAASGTNERDPVARTRRLGRQRTGRDLSGGEAADRRGQGDRAAGPQGGARRYDAGGGRAGRAQEGAGADALSSLSPSPTLRTRPPPRSRHSFRAPRARSPRPAWTPENRPRRTPPGTPYLFPVPDVRDENVGP